MSVYGHFTNLERRFRQLGVVYSVPWAIRAANADGRLYESIATFAERAFNDFPADKHIAPQTGWGAETCEIIAPLHQAKWVSLPAPLPHVNSTSPIVNAGETTGRIREFYADDITYWNKVCGDFHSKNLSAWRPNMDGQAGREVEERAR